MKKFLTIAASLLFVFCGLCSGRVSAQSGNVGIGTTSPQAKLHILPDSAAALAISPFGASAGQTGQIRLMELSANGTNYVGVKAPDAMGGNVIWVLPSADGSNGQVLSTNGSGTLNWITPSGGGGGGGGSNSHCYTCDGF